MTAQRLINIFDKYALTLFNAFALGGVSIVAMTLVAQG
jgi:hypothetical protein